MHPRACRVQSSVTGQMLRPSHGAPWTTHLWGTSTSQYRTTSDVWISIPRMNSAGGILPSCTCTLGRTDDALRFYEMGLENGYTVHHAAFAPAAAARGDRLGALSMLADEFRDDPQ